MGLSKVKRKLDVVIISDVHLGTYGCRAKELLRYLKSIDPKKIVLNGDIIDIWQFSKNYFPKSHIKVVKYFMSMMSEGVEIHYITGNHDEMLRRFAGFKLGTFQIANKLLLNINNETAWIFHGDVFDVVMKNSKWLAKLGGKGYDVLILINTFVNWISLKLGWGKISFSKKIKNSVKGAVKHINKFEETAAEIAIDNNYRYVICGHIHHPQIRTIDVEGKGSVIYLNSGDWIENMTALEYNNNMWSIYSYLDDPAIYKEHLTEGIRHDLQNAEKTYDALFNELLVEFQIKTNA